MAVTVELESEKLAIVRISGLLKKSDMDAALAEASKKLQDKPDARFGVLMIIEDFEGWEGGANWADMSFYAAYGDRMAKIAFVCDPKRQQDWMMFMGGGIRPAPVKYFPPDKIPQARMWLKVF
jgi:hypothetical protein